MYNSQSINQRLKNFAKKNNIPNVERARVILCLERIVARLMQDDFLCSKLVFGGGFVLYKEANSLRFTTDIDAIVSEIEKEELIQKVNNALRLDLGDGFWFGETKLIKLEMKNAYSGLRFKIPYKAGLPLPPEQDIPRLRNVQLDIAVGVDLSQLAKRSIMSSTLEIYKEIEWSIYPLEFICAEKIHCLVNKADLNTRGKDVFDLGMLLPNISNKDLKVALEDVFRRRSRSLTSLLNDLHDIDTSFLKSNFLKVLSHLTNKDFNERWEVIIEKIRDINR